MNTDSPFGNAADDDRSEVVDASKEPPRRRVWNGKGSGGFMIGRKVRCDNKMFALKPEVQFELWDLSKSKSGKWLQQWLLEVHNLPVDRAVMYKFLKRYDYERSTEAEREKTRDAVERLVTDKFLDGNNPETIDSIESMMMAKALANGDPAAYVALQKLKIEREKLRIEREKVELNKRKLDQLDQLEGIVKDETLTSEQKGQMLDKVLA